MNNQTPNILLLSCSTGQGHNSAALALAEELRRRDLSHTLADPIAFRSERASRIVAAAYNRMIQKAPRAFNLLYRAGDLYSRHSRFSPIYYANAGSARALGQYIDRQGITAVICTHLFAMETMTAARRQGLTRVPCYGVLTDYTCIPFMTETRLDGYFIPHESLVEEFAAQGVPREELYPTGIPVSRKFASHPDRAVARQTLGLPADKAVVLVMGGGAGSGHFAELCAALQAHGGENWLAAVLVGRNEALARSLAEAFGDDPRIRLVPFTKQVELYMAAADVMITKPGGLTSTEAAVAGVPLVHLLSYAACEARNVAFFTARGLSVQAQDGAGAAAAAWQLIDDPARAAAMVAAQHAVVNPQAACAIIDKVVGA